MILEVTYGYTASVRVPRARTWSDRQYRGTATFSLPEVALEETDLVAWWTPPELSGVHQTALRSFENALYQPMATESDPTALPLDQAGDFYRPAGGQHVTTRLKNPAFVSPGALQDMASVSFSGLLSSGIAMVCHPEPLRLPRIEDDRTIAECGTTNRDAMEARIAKELARLVVIGGVVHCRITMPFISVFNGTITAGHNAGAGFQTFALDQLEAALAAAYSHQSAPKVPFDKPEIVRPDLVPARHPLAVDASNVASQLIQSQISTAASYRRPLHDLPLETILAWYALRDSLAAEADTERLLDCLEAYLVSYPNDRQPDTTHSYAKRLLERRNAAADDDLLATIGLPGVP
ncbi:hypothetical protein [Bosea sp. RAC05]|uniref:hypothetical protein n=1 Tax=Bosea sp. RAC05 TaxID=1842539 RepID=UPI00083D9DEA|nr:hypothetical protein [Bosea sp. RAC05]AOG03114.1 hypothetical protein BSY19_4946 [Bosea sp. RAC05]